MKQFPRLKGSQKNVTIYRVTYLFEKVNVVRSTISGKLCHPFIDTGSGVVSVPAFSKKQAKELIKNMADVTKVLKVESNVG